MNEFFLSAILAFASPDTTAQPMNIGARLKAAFGLVFKGSIAPFDKFIDYGATGASDFKRPYAQSPWVQRAVKLVALPITEVPLRISNDMRGGKQLVIDPDLEAYWEKPAIGPDKQPLSFAEVIEHSVIHLKLCGEIFWLLDDKLFVDRSNLPFPEVGLSFPRFVIAKPDRMNPIKAKGDMSLIAWEWQDGAGRRVVLDKEQVIHIRYTNPYDDFRGLSEYEAAKVSAESDYLAGVFKKNVMASNGDQGPIIGVKSPLDDIQRKQLEAQLRDKRELASRGIFKTLFLSSDITVEDPTVKTVDTAFAAVRAEDRHAIAVAFGVPPSMFEVTASYSIGSASDRYRLIVDTCAPTAKKLSEAIERIVNLQKPGETLFAWFDWRQHQIMQQVLRELIDPASKLWDRGMSWESVNEWLGLNLPEFEGRDIAYLPFSVTPADSIGLDAAEFNEPMPAVADDDGEAKMFDEMRCPVHGKGNKLRANDSNRKLWESHMRKRMATVKGFESAFNRALFAARKDVIGKLAVLNSAKGIERKSAGADFIFDLAKWRGGLLAAMRPRELAALDTAGQQFNDEAGIKSPWKHPPAKAQQFVKERENLLAHASEEIWEDVRGAISDGLDAGDPVDDIAKEVRAKFNGISKARSRAIALTETGAAYGEARQEAMAQSEIPFKKWLTSRADNVRPAHQEAEGQVVRVHEPFEVGGAFLMGPGDSSMGAGPELVINCHCVAIAVMKETGEIEA